MRNIKEVQYTIKDFEGNKLILEKYIDIIYQIEDLEEDRNSYFESMNTLDNYIKQLKIDKNRLEALVKVKYEEIPSKKEIKNECNIQIINPKDRRNG